MATLLMHQMQVYVRGAHFYVEHVFVHNLSNTNLLIFYIYIFFNIFPNELIVSANGNAGTFYRLLALSCLSVSTAKKM